MQSIWGILLTVYRLNCNQRKPCSALLLSGELLSERCSTDDLVPNIPILGLLHAVWTPKFSGWTSSSTVPCQVIFGWPGGLLQSAGGRSAAAIMRRWSSSGAVRARWPKNLTNYSLPIPSKKQKILYIALNLMYTFVRSFLVYFSKPFASFFLFVS